MKRQTFTIRDVSPDDTAEIGQIYNHYITHSTITFEEESVSDNNIIGRIRTVQSCQLPWLIAEEHGKILGYSYAGRWKEREAYRYSAEVTVYLTPDQVGRGIGTALYDKLLHTLKSQGIHTAIGVIALPNEASIKLHEKMGFRKAAHFNEVGFKFNRWIDVGYWQFIL